jgi:hypothetical protein
MRVRKKASWVMVKKQDEALVVPEVLSERLHTELACVAEPPVAPDRMSDRAPDQVRRDVKRLRANVESNYWKLSEALWHVYDKVLYQNWGFASWREYVEAEVDFELRKAQYLVQIWAWRRTLPAPLQERIDRLGASKARDLAPVVTAENAEGWLERVEGLSTREVQRLVRGEADAEQERLDALPTGAAADADEEKPKIQQKPVKKGWHFMRAQLDPVERAIQKACDMTASESEPHALAMICTEFLATNMNRNEPAEYLAQVEHATGWRLVAIDPQDGKVLYGGALLEAAEQAGAAAAEESAPTLPDPTQDLAGHLKALQDLTQVRLVAFAGSAPEILFGETTLADIGNAKA